jgi:hypothetical protein
MPEIPRKKETDEDNAVVIEEEEEAEGINFESLDKLFY